MIELAMTVEEELLKLRSDTRAKLAQSPKEQVQVISDPYTINTEVIVFRAIRKPAAVRRGAFIDSTWYFNGKRIGWNALRGKLERLGLV